MEKLSYEQLAALKQDGKIGWCEFALRSEHGTQYLQWCDNHGIEPDDVNAELILEEAEACLFNGFLPELL